LIASVAAARGELADCRVRSSSSSAPASTTTSSSASARRQARRPGAGSTGAAASGKRRRLHGDHTGGINDKPFNQSAWQACQQAAAANPNVTVEVPAVHYAERLRAEHSHVPWREVQDHRHRRLPDGRRDGEPAGKNPTQDFAIVDCLVCLGLPDGAKESNIDQLTFNTVQDGFLGGYLAAGMSKSGKVATFGGQDFGTVTIYMDGYWDGVSTTTSSTRPTSRCSAGMSRPRRASSPVTSPTRRRARRSPRRSSARARTSSSRWPGTWALARPKAVQQANGLRR